MIRGLLKHAVNFPLSLLNARAVAQGWGPRGFVESFQELKERGFGNETIWDIGASDGCWTRQSQTVYTDSRYYLFEPLRSHKNQLESFSSVDPKIEFYPLGVANVNGQLTLNSHKGQSSILPSVEWCGDEETIEVRTADSIIEMTGVFPDCVKVDIQGYELAFLEGFVNNLQHCKFLLIEVSWIPLYSGAPFAAEIISHLATRGFHVYDVCTYAQRPLDNRLTQSDLLFANVNTGLFSRSGWAK